MPSVLLRGVLRTTKINGLRTVAVRYGSAHADAKPAFILKFDPHDDPDFTESVRHPIPAGPRMIVIPDELKPLKQKELGDWKDISMDEQMDLYNMYFGMTIAEMEQKSDASRTYFGIAFMYMTFVIWLSVFIRKNILAPRDEYWTSGEWLKDHVKWQLKARYNPITGYPSLWDYENNRWKD